MIVCSFQTCFWKDVLRAVVIFAGAVSLPMSGTDVAVGAQVTDFLPVSLSVISFQSVPPHCGPGAATRAPAGRAKAVAQAAVTAAATTTNRILGPPEGVDRTCRRDSGIIGCRPDGQHARRGYPSRGSLTPRMLRT